MPGVAGILQHIIGGTDAFKKISKKVGSKKC